MPPDYKQFTILYVDDEEKSLTSFARAFGEEFRILTAPNAQEGLKLLEQYRNDIGVLMTDQRMPGEKGVWLLESCRQLNPGIVRILATAYSDMDAAIAAVNSGAIYKFVNKPWDPPQLEQTLKRALEFFSVQRERDILVQEKLSVLQSMTIADRLISLGLLAAGLSHHIRNALVAVKTFLDLAPLKLQDEKGGDSTLKDPGFWKDYHANVLVQIERINNLLKDLWAASERAPTQFNDQIAIHKLAAEAIESLTDALAEKRIAVVNHVPTDLPELLGDHLKLSRLFDLLLKDELANLPPGCRVEISARKSEDGKRPELEIKIRDNGPGLPPDTIKVLFDPFMVRSDSPSEQGIHLMACFFIVHHHGGKIDATSQEGKGTTFTIRLPLHPERTIRPESGDEFIRRAAANEGAWQSLRTAR